MTGVRPRPGRGPSVTLPLSYLATGAAAFLLASLGVPWLAGELAGHYYHPRLLALTHTVALGWITLTIMGASYQLIPIVLARPLFSERLARWQLLILAAGIVGMVAHFYIGHRAGLVWAAAVVGVGIVVHLVNVTLTLRGLPRWSFTARLVAGAHGGLGGTLLFGLALAAARASGAWPADPLAAVQAHFHLALLGWVAPMVMGVSARVYPMFLLAPEPGAALGWAQLGGLGLGVPVLVAGLLAAPGLVLPGALAVAAALGAHATGVATMARRRKRPALDWGLRFVLTGTAFLLPATLLGLGLATDRLSGPRPALAYAVLALGGWVSVTIVGMLLKIVPFLVWTHVYAPHAGRAPVPTLAQLSWPVAEGLAYAGLTGGIAALAAAVAAGAPEWIRAAGVLLALGAFAFGATLARVLSHLTAGAARRPAATSASVSSR
ncbi:MAG: hypothetical protein HY002_05635 [Candidatus Rokubacteria bacterium]|nr:hypothetical protein [Candidatus Rokubacteria bacterium]